MNDHNENLLVDYIVACTNLYGLVPIEKVVKIYNGQNEEPISLEAAIPFVNLQVIKEQLEERFVYVDFDLFVAEAVIELDERTVLEQLATGKPYYVPGKEELLLFLDEQYFQHTPEQERLRQQLRRNFGDSIDIEREVAELVLNLQISGGDFTSVLSFFLEGLELPVSEAERYIPLIIDIANTTRLWENRGHTPDELVQLINSFK
ncbi:hypothetical protein [Sporosarcina obsidiansis]|uniref:hypothetical protein n=1 Tax=Sporosarcina obsidiansis TaxID=2660748 RepID=UPI00129B7152|nr:hypothetical protein [Sporosarcina obsidiansis]